MFDESCYPLRWVTAVIGAALLGVSLRVDADPKSSSVDLSAAAIIGQLEQQPPGEAYELYAIKVGDAPKMRRGLLIADPSLGAHIEAAFAFWAIKTKSRLILIDCGFRSKHMAKKWDVVGFRDPEAALTSLGWTPKDVTDVIVTHTHWDHVGGLSLFFHARLWISKEALRGIPAKGSGLPAMVRDARREKRLEVMERLHRVVPGVLVVTTGLHAPGSAYVVVRGKQTPWVFASDEAPLWANFEKNRPTGQSQDRKKSLEVQAVMLKLVEQDLFKIVPGHEPKIFNGKTSVKLE